MADDLNYGTVFLVNTPLLEIVDDKWRSEKLPDDDILLPPEVPPIEEIDEQRDKKEDDKWTELALTDFNPPHHDNK